MATPFKWGDLPDAPNFSGSNQLATTALGGLVNSLKGLAENAKTYGDSVTEKNTQELLGVLNQAKTPEEALAIKDNILQMANQNFAANVNTKVLNEALDTRPTVMMQRALQTDAYGQNQLEQGDRTAQTDFVRGLVNNDSNQITDAMNRMVSVKANTSAADKVLERRDKDTANRLEADRIRVEIIKAGGKPPTTSGGTPSPTGSAEDPNKGLQTTDRLTPDGRPVTAFTELGNKWGDPAIRIVGGRVQQLQTPADGRVSGLAATFSFLNDQRIYKPADGMSEDDYKKAFTRHMNTLETRGIDVNPTTATIALRSLSALRRLFPSDTSDEVLQGKSAAMTNQIIDEYVNGTPAKTIGSVLGLQTERFVADPGLSLLNQTVEGFIKETSALTKTSLNGVASPDVFRGAVPLSNLIPLETTLRKKYQDIDTRFALEVTGLNNTAEARLKARNETAAVLGDAWGTVEQGYNLFVASKPNLDPTALSRFIAHAAEGDKNQRTWTSLYLNGKSPAQISATMNKQFEAWANDQVNARNAQRNALLREAKIDLDAAFRGFNGSAAGLSDATVMQFLQKGLPAIISAPEAEVAAARQNLTAASEQPARTPSNANPQSSSSPTTIEPATTVAPKTDVAPPVPKESTAAPVVDTQASLEAKQRELEEAQAARERLTAEASRNTAKATKLPDAGAYIQSPKFKSMSGQDRAKALIRLDDELAASAQQRLLTPELRAQNEKTAAAPVAVRTNANTPAVSNGRMFVTTASAGTQRDQAIANLRSQAEAKQAAAAKAKADEAAAQKTLAENRAKAQAAKDAETKEKAFKELQDKVNSPVFKALPENKRYMQMIALNEESLRKNGKALFSESELKQAQEFVKNSQAQKVNDARNALIRPMR